MSTIFMNSENNKFSDANRLRLNIIDIIDLRKGNNRVALTNLSIYYTLKNMKKSCRNSKFKVSGNRSLN